MLSVEFLRKFLLLAAVVWDQYEQQQSNTTWFSGLPLTVCVIALVLHVQVHPHVSRVQHYLQMASLIGVSMLYGLPSITHTSTSSGHVYQLIASYSVFVYIGAFTAVSALMALYHARKSIFGAFLMIAAGLFNICRFSREQVTYSRPSATSTSINNNASDAFTFYDGERKPLMEKY